VSNFSEELDKLQFCGVTSSWLVLLLLYAPWPTGAGWRFAGGEKVALCLKT